MPSDTDILCIILIETSYIPLFLLLHVPIDGDIFDLQKSFQYPIVNTQKRSENKQWWKGIFSCEFKHYTDSNACRDGLQTT